MVDFNQTLDNPNLFYLSDSIKHLYDKFLDTKMDLSEFAIIEKKMIPPNLKEIFKIVRDHDLKRYLEAILTLRKYHTEVFDNYILNDKLDKTESFQEEKVLQIVFNKNTVDSYHR